MPLDEKQNTKYIIWHNYYGYDVQNRSLSVNNYVHEKRVRDIKSLCKTITSGNIFHNSWIATITPSGIGVNEKLAKLRSECCMAHSFETCVHYHTSRQNVWIIKYWRKFPHFLKLWKSLTRVNSYVRVWSEKNLSWNIVSDKVLRYICKYAWKPGCNRKPSYRGICAKIC